MKNKLIVLGLAVVCLATLTVGCNKQETTTPPVSAKAINAPDQAADALNAANVQKAADSQQAADDLKAADAQKLRETTAQKQAEADKADQALKQAAADKLGAEQASVDKQSQPATGPSKVQSLIDSAKTLSGENKWAEVLQILAQLAGEKLSPAQQTAVDGLKSDAQKQTQATVAKKATSDARSAQGSLLDPKK